MMKTQDTNTTTVNAIKDTTAGNTIERIYLDYAATSPLAPGVLAAMLPYFEDRFGNASSLYARGKQARNALEDARGTIARVIGASAPEVTFCSGGTEADNSALVGIAAAARRRRGARAKQIIVSAFEHHALLEPAKALKSAGFDVAFIQPTRDGYIAPDHLRRVINKDTVVVSIMTVQNEIGTIQPIAELAAIAHEHGALFHTDAVAALGNIPFDVRTLGVDAASFSAHKIGGPTGIGALYLKQGTPFEPMLRGGGQESARRSGTQNVAAAVGFAAAAAYACKHEHLEAKTRQLLTLRDYLVARLMALDVRVRMSNPIAPGDVERHVPGLVSCMVDGFESESLLLRFDEAGIALSGGAACATSLLEPSHVLMALGTSKRRAYGALRISMGELTNCEDIDTFLEVLSGILNA